jgi:hypothetical protein
MKRILEVGDLSADASQIAKASGVANIVSAGVGVGSSVFSVISNIQDNKQRALFESNFRSLSSDQQKKIDQQVSSARTQSEKLSIIANSLTQLGVARINTQATLVSEEEKKKRNEMILIGGVMIATALLITIVIIKKY